MASEDHNLIDAMWTGFDIHGHWSDRILKVYPAWLDWLVSEFGVEGDDKKAVHKTGRQEAKNKWVFPQFFGSSAYSCARNLHLPNDVADRLQAEFWDQFRGVQKWQRRILLLYERNLYVETLTGRRRRGPMTPNEIINQPIQGTASDIVTDAMDRLSEESLVEDKPYLQPPLNVHDDLSFVIPDEVVEDTIEHIAYVMCDVQFDFINVPIVVEVAMGQRWHELKEVGVYRSDALGIHTRR
jgi:DNA polymerase-1